MTVGYMGCCAVKELLNIGHDGSAMHVLHKLCRELYVGSSEFYAREIQPSAFYVFTGVLKEEGSTGPEFKYGPDLAAYIKKHRLGVVTASAKRLNRVNHPDHLVQVWVWAPSEKNLKAWWLKNKGKV